MSQSILLNPGPVNVSQRVASALLRGDLCHREKEFGTLMSEIRQKLLKAFGVQSSFSPVLISGSGTAALEMAVSSCMLQNRSMLIVCNGIYGERIAKISECYGLEKHIVSYAWGEPPRLDEIERKIEAHPEIEVVSMVHHETTTGLLNPIGEVGLLVKKYKKKFLVDCISSLAGDIINFDGWGIDFCVGTANKCLQGVPGVSFVLFRRKDLDRLAKVPARSLYFNLFENFKAQEEGVPLFTPAIQAHYALDEALSELIEETVARRIARYRDAADLLRNGFEKLELEFLIPRKQFSNTLSSMRLPEGISYDNLHDDLKSKGYIIYAGQGNLNGNIFRVANMGDLTSEHFGRFLENLSHCLSRPCAP